MVIVSKDTINLHSADNTSVVWLPTDSLFIITKVTRPTSNESTRLCIIPREFVARIVTKVSWDICPCRVLVLLKQL